MLEPESILSAKQVAEKLHISSGMLRRYALALEEITGQPIRQHPRDGRQYSADDLETLQRAKAFITANRGMSVDHALRLALGASETDMVQQPSLNQPTPALEGFTEAYRLAQEPLLSEMRALRESNERLTVALNRRTDLEIAPVDHRDPIQVVRDDRDALEGGALVRFARHVERILGRR